MEELALNRLQLRPRLWLWGHQTEADSWHGMTGAVVRMLLWMAVAAAGLFGVAGFFSRCLEKMRTRVPICVLLLGENTAQRQEMLSLSIMLFRPQALLCNHGVQSMRYVSRMSALRVILLRMIKDPENRLVARHSDLTDTVIVQIREDFHGIYSLSHTESIGARAPVPEAQALRGTAPGDTRSLVGTGDGSPASGAGVPADSSGTGRSLRR
nr:hypothetical protein [Paenibacillus dendritiformis]